MIYSKDELTLRRERLVGLLDKQGEWDTVLFVSHVAQLYLLGTMQDGVLVLRKDGTFMFFVRKSYERAVTETESSLVFPISTYKDIAAKLGNNLGITYLETEKMTLGILERLEKVFTMTEKRSVDRILNTVRAVKTPFEQEIMRECGSLHDKLIHEIVPTLCREGITEPLFIADIYKAMIGLGHHGVARFSMFELEMVVGQIGFGTSSLMPTSFDGPGGNAFLSPAAPFLGNPERRLTRGDLVFVDVAFGYKGYHTDKTGVYIFGANPSRELTDKHNTCLRIQRAAAARLVPGAIPADIYNELMESADVQSLDHFMGFGERRVRFLGHGTGLYVDEYPIIAAGFKQPLEAGMTVALEPKCGVDGVGMVGVEDTFIVTETGGVCITGAGRELVGI